jgi:hypothetical protein
VGSACIIGVSFCGKMPGCRLSSGLFIPRTTTLGAGCIIPPATNYFLLLCIEKK